MLHFAGVYIGRFGVYPQYLGEKTAQNAVSAAHVFGGAAAFGRQRHPAVRLMFQIPPFRQHAQCARYAGGFDAQQIPHVGHAGQAVLIGGQGNGFQVIFHIGA